MHGNDSIKRFTGFGATFWICRRFFFYLMLCVLV